MMIQSYRKSATKSAAITAAGMLLLCFAFHAPAAQAEETAGQKVGHVVDKTGNGIKKGAEWAGNGIKKGAEATGRGISKGAHWVATGVKKGVHKTGEFLTAAGDKLQQGGSSASGQQDSSTDSGT